MRLILSRRFAAAISARLLIQTISVLGVLAVCTPDAFAQCAPASPVTETYEAGPGATAPAYRSTAVGSNASAVCENSVAIGANASTSGAPGGGTAVGSQSSTVGINATAIGVGANATGDTAISLGGGAKSSADGAIAIGAGAKAPFQNSVALGLGAQTSAANQFMLGTGASLYVMPGITSAASATAQSGLVQYLTTDANGKLAAATAPGSIPVINNLTTGGTTSALSAQQGVTLNTLVGTAQSTATTALSGANTAQNAAANAQSSADSALNVANTAQATATLATTSASTAQSIATSAQTAAAAAQSTADSAQVSASSARVVANGALQRSGGTMTGDIDMNGNRISNVAAPIDGGDAVTKDYADAQYLAFGNGLANVQSQITSLAGKVDENTEGIAIAMAMGGLAIPDGKTFAVAANLGFYDDKQAIATQAALKLDQTFTLTGGLGVGLNTSSKVGGRVGFSAAW